MNLDSNEQESQERASLKQDLLKSSMRAAKSPHEERSATGIKYNVACPDGSEDHWHAPEQASHACWSRWLQACVNVSITKDLGS